MSEGFLYIASVSVIPELLEESRSMTQAIKEVCSKPTNSLLNLVGIRLLILVLF